MIDSAATTPSDGAFCDEHRAITRKPTPLADAPQVGGIEAHIDDPARMLPAHLRAARIPFARHPRHRRTTKSRLATESLNADCGDQG